MYRSVRLLRTTAPLASPAFRAQARPVVSLENISFKRVLSTSPIRFKDEESSDHAASRKTHNVENQNYTTTAKEELKSVTKDLASLISGGPAKAAKSMSQANEISSHSHHGSVADDFRTLTRETFADVPKPAMLVGLAGTIPYLGTAVGTIVLAREASRASMGLNTITGFDLQTSLDALHLLEKLQISYGATILAFLGAIHWGYEFAKVGGEQGYRRLALGVIPVLYAVPTTFLPHGIALVAQWFGFTGLWMLDQRAATNSWTPRWYSTYRFYLSLIVGFSIMATFAGEGYYGAGAGASTAVSYPSRETYSERMSGLKRLDKVGEKNRPKSPNAKVGKVEGQTKSPFILEENEDSYLKLIKVADEEEEAEEEEEGEDETSKEEEKQKNQEFQDKRDEHQQDKAPGAMKDTAKDRTGANENVQDESQKK